MITPSRCLYLEKLSLHRGRSGRKNSAPSENVLGEHCLTAAKVTLSQAGKHPWLFSTCGKVIFLVRKLFLIQRRYVRGRNQSVPRAGRQENNYKPCKNYHWCASAAGSCSGVLPRLPGKSLRQQFGERAAPAGPNQVGQRCLMVAEVKCDGPATLKTGLKKVNWHDKWCTPWEQVAFSGCVGFPCDIRVVAHQGMRAFCPLPTWLVLLLLGHKTKFKLPACWTWISSFW